MDFETGSSEEKILILRPDVDRFALIAALSSSLWFWYFETTSDCRHLGNRDISSFPFDPRTMQPEDHRRMAALGRQYVHDLRKNAEKTVRVYKGKKSVKCLSFRAKESKAIIDEIDTVMAGHFGLSEEELDFVVNYHIKYRMGQETAEAVEEEYIVGGRRGRSSLAAEDQE